jgi:uncharacterized protein YecT (DUF1311 family)
LEIARTIIEKAASTVVEEGAGCFSACAIIFMAGNTSSNKGQTPSRLLHVSGTLGFHAPYLIARGTDYSAADLEAEYDSAVSGIRQAMSLELDYRNVRTSIIPTALFAEMLGKGRNEAFIIENLDHAAAWDIELFGYPDLVVNLNQITEREFDNACTNALAWSQKSFAGFNHPTYGQSRSNLPISLDRKKAFGSHGFRIVGEFDANRMCVVDIDLSSGHAIWVSLFDRLRTYVRSDGTPDYQRWLNELDFPASLSEIWSENNSVYLDPWVLLDSGTRISRLRTAIAELPQAIVVVPAVGPETTPARTATPSFDCARASTDADLTICNDVDLADLDRRLANLYFRLRDREVGARRDSLVQSQRDWLRQRNACGNNPTCLRRAYQGRLAELGE